VLQCVVVFCSVLQCERSARGSVAGGSVLHCAALCCTVLKYASVCCNVMQCAAV